MRKPSSKTLARAFGENAREARRIFEMSRAELKTRPDVQAVEMAAFSRLRTEYLRMHALNTCGDFYGFEALQANTGEWVEYLNAGDVYNETVIFWRGVYRVQTLGDFVETMERRAVRFP
jgi:hypothetical protein